MDITNIQSKGGMACANPMEAVERFKCPGPCGADCPLYPTMTLSNGKPEHMCHPEIVTAYPFSVLDAMGCSYTTRVGEPVPKRYVAVIRPSAARDVQVAKIPDADPMDDDVWADQPDAQVYLGLFSGPDALARAAAYGCTDPANVTLIPVDEGGDTDGR